MSHDGYLLSSYFDNELDDAAARQIGQRLKEDASLARQIREMQALRGRLALDLEGEQEARERILKRLRHRQPRPVSIWYRRVDIPLPALAAAALLIVAFGGFSLRGALPIFGPSEDAGATPEVDVTISMEQVEVQQMLEWLNRRDMLDQVTIELPESPVFRLRGEPELVRAADLQREPEHIDGNG